MAYVVNGEALETDDTGLPAGAADYPRRSGAGDRRRPRASPSTDDHWKVVRFLRDEYREHGHTPNFRNMLKGLADVLPGCDSKSLYDLFPTGPAKQGAKVAGCRSRWARADTDWPPGS